MTCAVLRTLIVAVAVAGLTTLARVAGARSRSAHPAVAVIGPVAWSPTRDELALGARVDGASAIFLVHPDGSGLRRVTPAFDRDPRAIGAGYPVWAQGGYRLAFTSGDSQSPNGTTLVRVIDRDSTRLRTVAAGDWPSWAPDGRHLAFGTFDPAGSPSGLAVANVQSGAVRSLSPRLTSPPQWQPHGRLIVFDSACGGHRCGVFLVRADGGGLHRIAVGEEPAWSSDGRLLALRVGSSVCVLRADGGGERCLGRLYANSLAWAPGRRLLAVLVSYGVGYTRRGGFVIDVSTGRKRRVLGPAAATQAEGPSWSRDAQSLAFVTSSHRIFIVRNDGSGGHYLHLHT